MTNQPSDTPNQPADETPLSPDTVAFREGRIARLTAEEGWLTLVARYPLDRGDNVLPIGTVTLDAAGVARLSVSPGLVVTCDGQVVNERTLRSDSDGGPDRIIHDGLIYELIRRGEIYVVRVRDPLNPRRHQFHPPAWFPVRPDWSIVGRFEAFDHDLDHDLQDRLIAIPYDLGPVLSRSPGQVVLELFGSSWRLDTLMDDERKRLFILFGDATNRDETYGAGRFLYTPLPDATSGRVIIDFNRALNPACAFTEFATCPLPPPQNRFPFRVEAGEKRYLDH